MTHPMTRPMTRPMTSTTTTSLRSSFLKGVYTALVTPFTPQGEIDESAYRHIIEDQINAQVNGIVPCGTTGESPTLTRSEKEKLILISLEMTRGTSVRVMAGTGTNSTAETVEFSKWASDAGVSAILVVTPYYNKPTQAGLLDHFTQAANAVSCEVMLYNVPGRTITSIAPETMVSLASHPRITSVKEASGNVALTSEILNQLRTARKDLTVLSGDDASYFPILCVGGHGVVSVASNLFPRAMVAIHRSVEAGDLRAARETHDRFYPLFRDLFVESNPGPIKAAMESAGFCTSTLRAPLAPLSSKSMQILKAAMNECGIKAGVKS